MTSRIRVRRLLVLFVFGLLLLAKPASAQITGTLSGHVADPQGLAVPGATVSVTSPSLQGQRVTTTSARGDFLLPGLPPGVYTVAVELAGFEPASRSIAVGPGQSVPVAMVLGVATVEARVEVTARTADVFTGTALVAANFQQDLLSTLPTTRDLSATLLMLAPGVHATGPGGAFSLGGGPSFESLFLLDGHTVNENIRGQAQTLYIEDAVQETAVATGGISAEYGRFSGGLVNMVTKSGGNTFSGSLRETLNNDRWRALTPFEQTAIAGNAPDARVDNVVPTYEYTFGGPVLRDRLWFFHAGRVQTQQAGRTLVVSNIPYVFTDESRRYEAKGTFAVTAAHRLQAAFTKVVRNQFNNPNSSLAMDVRSLTNQRRPEALLTVTYTGELSRKVFLEGRYSRRDATTTGAGATSRDLIEGTTLVDLGRNFTRYWADSGCGVCGPEQRDNRDAFVKGSYFVSRPGMGTHAFVGGYNLFDDQRQFNNRQSGSDYRIVGRTILVGTGTNVSFVPQFLSDGSTFIQWSPIPLDSQGSRFRTHSLFVNDQWRVSTRVSASLGLRWDRNQGIDSSGHVVARDGAWSPRVGLAFDPAGDGRWSLTGSVGRYVAAVANSIADGASPAGNPQTSLFTYLGPSINPPGATALTSTPDAIRAVFDWFFANGGTSRPTMGAPNVPGITPQIRESLGSPGAWEYAGGVTRQFGARATVRADGTYRRFGNFYAERTDRSTGVVRDPFGRAYDLALIQNASDGIQREYAALTVQGTYRFGTVIDVGGNYTLSRTWGNFDGESLNSGPTRFSGFSYPEYKQASWNYPSGDLSLDQRHRARLWVNYRPSGLQGLTLSLLQSIESGVPYGAVAGNGVNPAPYVVNPGYLTPPTSAQTAYYFGPRDEFRTEGQRRSDLSVQYVHGVPGARRAQLFGQLQVINAFNQSQLCACGGTVFENGGAVSLARIDQTVLTAVSAGARYQTFNPFTTTPVRGTNWDLGPNFGAALNRLAYTSPRQLRLTFGVRF